MTQDTRESRKDPSSEPFSWPSTFATAAVGITLAAVLWAVAYSLAFLSFNPEFESFTARVNAQAISFSGDRFIPVQAGNGGYNDGSAVITEFQNGAVILELREPFQAEDYPFIQFEIEGLTTWSDAFVFWQQAEAPGVIHRLPLQRHHDGVNQVAMVYGGPDYRRQISTLAIGFIADPTGNDNAGQSLTLKSVELVPFSPARVAQQIFEDWRNPPLYRGYANNMVIGAPPNAILRPNTVIYLLLVTGIILLTMLHLYRRLSNKPSSSLAGQIFGVCCLAWVISISVRVPSQIQYHADHIERYSGYTLPERVGNHPIRCGRREDCFSNLQPYF